MAMIMFQVRPVSARYCAMDRADKDGSKGLSPLPERNAPGFYALPLEGLVGTKSDGRLPLRHVRVHRCPPIIHRKHGKTKKRVAEIVDIEFGFGSTAVYIVTEKDMQDTLLDGIKAPIIVAKLQLVRFVGEVEWTCASMPQKDSSLTFHTCIQCHFNFILERIYGRDVATARQVSRRAMKLPIILPAIPTQMGQAVPTLNKVVAEPQMFVKTGSNTVVAKVEFPPWHAICILATSQVRSTTEGCDPTTHQWPFHAASWNSYMRDGEAVNMHFLRPPVQTTVRENAALVCKQEVERRLQSLHAGEGTCAEQRLLFCEFWKFIQRTAVHTYEVDQCQPPQAQVVVCDQRTKREREDDEQKLQAKSAKPNFEEEMAKTNADPVQFSDSESDGDY